MAKGKFEDITGQRFGKLIATERIENKDNRPYFLCTCDCGKTKECSSQNLKKGNIQSCGCLKRELMFKDLTGKIFDRLTVIKANGTLGEGDAKKSAFLCKCSCGEEKIIRSGDLLSGKITSCGCWRNEKALENLLNINNSCKTPQTSSIVHIFNKNYNDGNLTIEQFIEMTKENCFYCGIIPNNNYNKFKDSNVKSSVENGNFNYNGLDRVDSNLPHDLENLVPCCKNCNMSKSNMTIEKFKQFIINSYNHLSSDILNICADNKYFYLFNNYKFGNSNRKYHPSISSAKDMFKNYNDGNLTFEKFLILTQHNCVYCNAIPANKYNEAKIRGDSSEYARQNGDFIYNGLDRIDSSLPHNIDNVVPSCHKCNWSKSDRTVEEYKEWIVRVYNHLIK